MTSFFNEENKKDHTARWYILTRREHKDGGYFWGGGWWVDGESAVDAIEKWGNALGNTELVVLDWETAQHFRIGARIEWMDR